MKIKSGRFKIFILAAAVGTGLFGAFVNAQTNPTNEQVIQIVAKKFNYAPNVIMLKKDRPVVLEFTTLDVVMGFNVPDLKIRTDIIPGKVSRVHLVPDKAGTFPFVCDIFCGSGHEDMSGKIIVT
ncbi:cupredoxin domain-containing protein [Sulfurirhabdus autotrophica]|uniref:Cytochrome c oxidase subunit 2 n=1 Tax=Sulfurirhabdus autotrophica TaxID=1706046 RepID=A0A4V2W329_9PROT|nr:cupredoxin domain-containing protein [Sulfurirhabdus autotrophica]TCV90319.1 cytochrome c oxidase subunit 2 [Sulfurirhabdus autotrophica]